MRILLLISFYFLSVSANAQTKSSVQEKAVGKKQELEKKINLKNISKSTDKIEGITWYTPKTAIKVPSMHEAIRKHAIKIGTVTDALSSRQKDTAGLQYASTFYIYLGQSTNSQAPFLRMVIKYAGTDWLFIRKYKFVADQVSTEIEADGTKLEQKPEEDGVYERLDTIISPEQIPLLEKISTSKESVIRFYGKDTFKDHVISKNEKAAIREILQLYNGLKKP